MTITTTQEGTTLTLAVDGRVDTNTSPELQNALLKAFQGAKKVIIDFEKVPYISSAGLRALLIGQKTAASKGAAMEMKNVSKDVYAILDSVGFAKLLTIN